VDKTALAAMNSHFDNQLAKLMSWGAAGDNTG